MKNYYEVLEVNENASKEVIEKAYKVLAKNIIRIYKKIKTKKLQKKK